MDLANFIDAFPQWAQGLIIVALALLSIETGRWLGKRRIARATEDNRASINAAVGATLGLLAFLLAFTFSMAAARYDSRKQLVLQEASAIGTTYLRADFLPDPSRDESRQLLREYLALRLGGVTVLVTPESMAQSAALLDRLWAIAREAPVTVPPSHAVYVSLFVQSLNEVINLESSRVAAGRNRIPDTIWLMLVLVLMFSMMALGYLFGFTHTHSWAITILMIVAFTIVILLIADLDQSQTGLLQVSQQPLIDLLNKIGTPTP